MRMGAHGGTLAKSGFKSEFEIIDSENGDAKLKKLDSSIKFLQLMKDDLKAFEKQNDILQAFKYVIYYLNKKNPTNTDDCAFDKLSSKSQVKLNELLLNLIKIIYKNLTQKAEIEDSEFDLNFWLLFELITTFEYLTTKSKTFCVQLLNSSGKAIESMLYLIDDFKLISSKDEEEMETSPYNNNRNNKLNCKSIIAILLNLTQHSTSDIWIKSNAITSLTDLLKKVKFSSGYHNWYTFLIIENINNISADSILKYNTSYMLNIVDEPDNEKISKINFGIKYLKSLNEASDILESEQAMNIFYYIKSLSDFSFDMVDDELQDDFLAIIIDSIKLLYKNIVNLFETLESSSTTDQLQKQHERASKKYMYFFENLTTIIQNFSDSSIKFCIRYHNRRDSMKVLIDFIKNEYLSNFLVQNLMKKHMSNLIMACYEDVIACLLNLSKVYYKFKKLWDSLDCVNSLILFSQKIGQMSGNLLFHVYMIISNIATDQQIETLQEIRVATKNITDLITSCATILMEKNGKIPRTKIQFDEGEDLFEVCFIHSSKTQKWNLTALLEALYHLSVNDSIKTDIYFTFMMKENLKNIIYNGNEIETEYSIKCLYQLCFDDKIAIDLAEDVNFIKHIKSFQNKMFKRKKTIQNTNGILWMLSNKNISISGLFDSEQPQPRAESTVPNQEQNINKHIMISYNSDSRDLCLKIKGELENLGFSVWIDVESISGSSLESMANAIEQSLCVLMCMTEKYKLSSNCRLEAEYAVQLNKPIIPLILQANYKPDGWLGIILGQKIYINFIKHNFDECMRRLKIEITRLTNPKKKEKHPPKVTKLIENQDRSTKSHNEEQQTDASKLQQTQAFTSSSHPQKEQLDWTDTDVNKWLHEQKIDSFIIESLKPCNGKTLYQLFMMHKTAPEFFYCTLRADANNKIGLKEIASFSYELNSLFTEDDN